MFFLCFTTYLASSFRSPLSSFATGLFRSNLFLLCSCQGARRVSVSSLLSKILCFFRVRYSVFRPNPENDTEFKTQSTINLHDSRLPCSCSRSHAFLLLLQHFRFHLLRKCFLPSLVLTDRPWVSLRVSSSACSLERR